MKLTGHDKKWASDGGVGGGQRKSGHVYNDIKNSDIKLTNNTNEQYCTPWVDVNVVINIFVIYISYKSQTHGYE